MDVTYNFTPGTRAVAGQVNQNFADVKSAVDVLETDVADLQAEVSGFSFIKTDGSVDFTRLQSYKTYTVSNATNATPIVITAVAHPFLTGDKVYISGVGGNTAANGVFTITKIGVDTFSLDGSVGNGAFASNGTVVIQPTSANNLISKRYYEDNTPPISYAAYVPYSVNSGAVDANGHANFISSLSSSSIKIAASTTPLVVTHPDGTQETISTDQNITSLGNGTYTILKIKGSDTLIATTNSVTESYVAPTGVDGDYYLNLDSKPYKSYKKVSGSWVATQYVKLGEVTIISATMGTPISYAFNGTCLTTPQQVVYGTPQAHAHNLGINPLYITNQLKFMCISPDLEYVAGDVVDGAIIQLSGGTRYNLSNGSVSPLKTIVPFGDTYNTIHYKTSNAAGDITATKWKMAILAKRSF